VEECAVAASRHRTKRPTGAKFGRRRLRLLWAVGLLVAAVYLYYRPISSYLETKHELASRQAEVVSLRGIRSELELRLSNFGQTESLEREARRIGYVKPGERLFVVKGIPAWRRARASQGH